MTIAALTSLAVLAVLATCVVVFDLKWMIIPDWVNAAVFATGLGSCFVLRVTEPVAALVAALVALAVLLAVRAIFRALRGYDGLGLGDVKFVAAAVGWTGAEGLPVALLAASVAALAYVLGRRSFDLGFDPRARIPFGPFLALGVVIVAGVQITTGRTWMDLVEPYLI